MTTSLIDLFQRTMDELSSEHEVELGLAHDLDVIRESDSHGDALERATKLLRRRARAMQRARQALDRLRESVSYLRTTLVFTQEGWEERSEELRRRLAEDPLAGLAEWLEIWFAAAAAGRVDALDRVAALEGAPTIASPVIRRSVSATAGLREGSWELARPMLEAGVAGVALGDRVVPKQDVRNALRVMLVRVALADGHLDDAERELNEIDEAAEPAAGALHAHLLRLRGDDERAAALLADASMAAPEDLDVAAEAILQAAFGDRSELAIDAARVAVDALPVLTDVEVMLARLIGPAPAEIWIAVAERALDERNFDLVTTALDRAVAENLRDDHVLAATIGELRVSALEASSTSDEHLADQLVEAGSGRLLAGQRELALAHLERALGLVPQHVEASIRLADCLVAGVADRPWASAASAVDRALDLIADVQCRGAITSDNSWSYLTEVDARDRVGRSVRPSRDEHAWRALLAACRSLVHEPQAMNRWGALALSAVALNLHGVALAAANQCHALAPEADFAIALKAQCSANSGEDAVALELLADQTDPWAAAVRAYVLLRRKERGKAVRVLRSTPLDPSWSWAAETLVSGLILTDRYDEALADARDLCARWSSRHDEYEGIETTAFASVVIGAFEEAEALIAELHEMRHDALCSALAAARFARGDVRGGLDALERAIRAQRSLRENDEWHTLVVPELRAVAAHHGFEVPPLDQLEGVLVEQRERLQRSLDPVTELAGASGARADPEVVDLAKAMGAALLRMAADELQAAIDPLRGSQDPDLVAVRELVEQRRDELEARDRGRRLAREAVTAIQQDPGGEGTRALRRLIDDDAYHADDRLLEVVGDDDDAWPPIVDVLRAMASDEADDADEVRLVLAWLGYPLYDESQDVVTPPVRVLMPTSWFEDHSDPVNDHAFFLRHLPEVRLHTHPPLPPIKVGTDDGLEPDGFQILVFGQEVARGRAQLDGTYFPMEARGLLSPAVAAGVDVDAELGLLRLVPDRADVTTAVDQLVAMSGLEVVARRVAEVVSAHPELFEERSSEAMTASVEQPTT
jgi:tetratricopeptide (TPR) repeat protein